MDEKVIAESVRQANIAMEMIRRGELSAGYHFWAALLNLDRIEDMCTKRNELVNISNQLFVPNGLYDLALFAIQSAIELDDLMQDHKGLIEHMIVYGDINWLLGNIDLASEYYRRVIRVCLDNDNYGHAASAFTSWAGILLENERPSEALILLNQSLTFLEKEHFPSVEIKTRILLINVLSSKKIEPARVIESAEVLFNLYANRIPRQAKKTISVALENAIEAYLVDHPELEPQSWRKRNATLVNYWKSE